MHANRRPVCGFDGYYEVDTEGNVYSLPRFGETPYGIRSYGGGQLNPFLVKGYQVVTLRMPGVQKAVKVHRLVLLAFRGPPADGLICCHNNGVKVDNRLENLRWDTPAGNGADMVLHGNSQKGEKSPNSKLNKNDVIEIRKKTCTLKEAAQRFGVSQSLIVGIRAGKFWSHI